MPNTKDDDMDDAPITRRELREELKASEQRTEQRTEAWGGALLHAIQQLPTRADLEKMRAETRADMDKRFGDVEKRFAEVPTRVEMETRFAQLERHMEQRFAHVERHVSAEIAQHTRASNEDARSQLAAIDDKYADLPARTARLEEQASKSKP